MKLSINPPPNDRKCMRCGKPSSECLPFRKEGDPLVGNFEGAKLVKIFRDMGDNLDIPDEQRVLYDKIIDAYCHVTDFTILEEEFGVEQVKSAMMYDQLCSTVASSWECRDCIIL
jgi:hypothetical protein